MTADKKDSPTGAEFPQSGDMKIGQRIAEVRQYAGFHNQTELAIASGLGQQTISNIETGRTSNPGIYSILALAETLNQSLEWLATGRERETSSKGRTSAEPVSFAHIPKELRIKNVIDFYETNNKTESPATFRVITQEIRDTIQRPAGLSPEVSLFGFFMPANNMAPEYHIGDPVLVGWRPLELKVNQNVLVERLLPGSNQMEYTLQCVHGLNTGDGIIEFKQHIKPKISMMHFSNINRILPVIDKRAMMGI